MNCSFLYFVLLFSFHLVLLKSAHYSRYAFKFNVPFHSNVHESWSHFQHLQTNVDHVVISPKSNICVRMMNTTRHALFLSLKHSVPGCLDDGVSLHSKIIITYESCNDRIDLFKSRWSNDGKKTYEHRIENKESNNQTNQMLIEIFFCHHQIVIGPNEISEQLTKEW